MQLAFNDFAKQAARTAGQPKTFILAFAGTVVWALSGFAFDFSDTWQLWMNTVTTVVTFLMVFILQNTQNRDTGAMQLKIDELIRAVEGAHKALLDLEDLSQEELDEVRKHYGRLAKEARENIQKGLRDTDTGE
jgi:low affinity Fe/Cu permease